MITSLQEIINATWANGSSQIEKLARWIRCLFTIALTSNTETAEQLLDQVVDITKSAKQASFLNHKLFSSCSNVFDSNA